MVGVSHDENSIHVLGSAVLCVLDPDLQVTVITVAVVLCHGVRTHWPCFEQAVLVRLTGKWADVA